MSTSEPRHLPSPLKQPPEQAQSSSPTASPSAVSPAASSPAPRRRGILWPQYTLGSLLRAMLIFSVLVAVLGGLLRGMEEKAASPAGFVVMALVAPLAVLIVLSVANGFRAAWQALRRRR